MRGLNRRIKSITVVYLLALNDYLNVPIALLDDIDSAALSFAPGNGAELTKTQIKITW
jgi:hypothetical protein